VSRLERVRRALRLDWLEIILTGLGLLFLALSAFLAFSFVYLAIHFMDPAPSLPIGRGMLQASKGYGLGVFGVGALVTFGVGWAFAGDAIRRRLRRRPGT
jgi:hypothetical protein